MLTSASIPARVGLGRAASLCAAFYPARYLRFGSYYLDLQREELFKGGARVKLQGKVFQALVSLIERSGEVVTREELRARLWPMDTHVNYDANVNTTVNKLRLALGDSSEESLYIETVPRRGYSFVARVEAVTRMEEPARLPGVEAHAMPAGAGAPGKNTWLERFEQSRIWFAAGVIALVSTGILAGAAIIFYLHSAL